MSESAAVCRAQLQLTAQDGEQAVVPVTIPARSRAKVRAVSVAPLYCFANPAGRAIYITIDDGWTPSPSSTPSTTTDLAVRRRRHGIAFT